MSKYYIDQEGTTKKVDTDNLVELYADGRWRGGRPYYYWMTKSKSRFFVEQQTHWQGEHGSLEEVTREQMIKLLASAGHQDRATKGLELMGAEEEIEEVE